MHDHESVKQIADKMLLNLNLDFKIIFRVNSFSRMVFLNKDKQPKKKTNKKTYETKMRLNY